MIIDDSELITEDFFDNFYLSLSFHYHFKMMSHSKAKIITLFIILVISLKSLSQTGYQVFNYPNGQVASEGMMRDGKPDGYWKTYYENGQLKSEGKRTDFLLDSTWVFFSDDGDTTLIINYRRGIKNGPRYTFSDDEVLIEPFVNDVRSGEGFRKDPKGHILQTITFKNGFEEGISPIFDSLGMLKEVITYRKGFVINHETLNRFDREGRKHGYWKTFFEDWSLHTEMYYRHGLRDGFYKEYDQQGNLKKIVKFVNDVEQVQESDLQPLQMQYEYYSNGQVKREASFRGDRREGIWREFDEQGNVVRSQTYKKGGLVSEGVVGTDGKRRGEYKEFFADSTLRAEGIFIDGERSGEWKFYYPNGKLQEIGKYKEGNPDGPWIWYHDNGAKQIEENFYKGLLNGSYKEYDASGNVIVSGTYFDGMKNGTWMEQIGDMRSEGEYRNDKQVGQWVEYYDDGTLAFRGMFNAGYPDGQHYFYYENGRIREIQSYAAGVRHGDWKKYWDTGELYFTITYNQGEEVKYDGEVIEP